MGQRIASIGVAELIHELLRRLRDERGWTPSELSRRTVVTGVDIGIGQKTIEAIEKNPGRLPKAENIEALARAFEIPPETFYEWPIAVALRDRGATPEAAQKRVEDRLRKEAERSRERPPAEPGTRRASRRRRGEAQ